MEKQLRQLGGLTPTEFPTGLLAPVPNKNRGTSNQPYGASSSEPVRRVECLSVESETKQVGSILKALSTDVGWQQNDIGSASGASELVIGADLGLHVNPGTAADEGTQLQFKIPSTAASLGSTHRVLPEFISTATLMDNREIFFQVRLGEVATTAASNNNKWMLGIMTDDDAWLNATSGVPAIAAGGGFGFHKGEAGAITGVSTEAAITAAGTAMSPAVNHLALDADATIEWHTYGARCRVIDADAGTGQTDFWVDGTHRLTLTTVPFDSTEVYSFGVAVANGPATVNVTDLYLDYILTGISRPGLTWPYNTGNF
jgi:hypothetical protein